MVESYYEDELVTIYNADWQDVLPLIERVDLVLTDPPYGIGWKPRVNHQDAPWVDNERPDLAQILLANKHCIWGGNYFTDHLPPTEAWLIWAKRPPPAIGLDFDNDNRSYAVCEMAWTDYGGKPQIKHHVWDGGMRAGDASNRQFNHPAQKPRALFWIHSWVAERPCVPRRISAVKRSA